MLVWLVALLLELVAESRQRLAAVPGHQEVDALVGVVPDQVCLGILFASLIVCHGVTIPEDTKQVLGVLLANIFGAKIIHNHSEADQVPILRPEARGVLTREVSMFLEALI